jgi:hypothetical protein
MPIHLPLLELQAFFRSDIEATEVRPFLARRYIVACHGTKVIVRGANSFLSA